MVPRIYISYRRSTDGAIAGRLADRLIQQLGTDNVFSDVSSLNAGENWLAETTQRLHASDVVLVIIGPEWLSATDPQGQRRILNPEDFVRFEISQSLKLDKLTIPILVDDARMPATAELPGDLAPLVRRQAVRISHSDFHRDVDRLIQDVGSTRPRASAPAARRTARQRAAPFALVLLIATGIAIWQLSRLPIHDWFASGAQWLFGIARNLQGSLAAVLSRIDWRDVLLVFNTALLGYLTWRLSFAPVSDARARAAHRQSLQNQAHRVFICYRREDSSYATSYIYDKLEAMLGAGVIFKDVDSIPYGTDFRTHVQQKLTNCQVCLIVIGKSWLNIADKDGDKRLFQDADPVRTEIETVLGREMLVIPILVDSAPMPGQGELPRTIEKLSSLNGIQVRPHPDFQADVQRLASAIS